MLTPLDMLKIDMNRGVIGSAFLTDPRELPLILLG